MVPLLGFMILVISSAINSQSHDANSQSPSRGRTRQRSVVDSNTTPFPPITRHANGEIEYRLNRLEILLVEKLENLRLEVRDTARRVQSLEYQSSEVHSTVHSIKEEMGRYSQRCSASGAPVVQDNEKLEFKVENLGKGIQILMAATRILTTDVESLKENVSSLINTTRLVAYSTSNLVSRPVFDHGLLELKQIQSATSSRGPSNSCPVNFTSATQHPKNCKEVQQSGKRISGIYPIQPEGAAKPFLAVCDFETRGGDWTVIQNRFDGSQDFYQNWNEYKYGFGNLEGEFWLGLENIHLLTGYEVNELLIELGDFETRNRSAFYSSFSVGSEIQRYSLKVLGEYSGDAGNSLLYHAGNRFSTKDMDEDNWIEGNCAKAHLGGWWYKSCDRSNLNGKYFDAFVPHGNMYQGVYWSDFRGPEYSLQRTRMLVRPRPEINALMLDDIFTHNIKESQTIGY